MKSMELGLLVSQFNPFDGSQLCLDADPEIFFPEYSNEFRDQYLDTVKAAKDICNDCWLINSCLKYALDKPDLDGVWGGTTKHERKKLRQLKTSTM